MIKPEARQLKILGTLFAVGSAFSLGVFFAIPLLRWMILGGLNFSFAWGEFFRVIGYSAGISAVVAIVMWVEGRLKGR